MGAKPIGRRRGCMLNNRCILVRFSDLFGEVSIVDSITRSDVNNSHATSKTSS